MNKKAVFWFRQDLRVSDNPGLFEAVKFGSVLPVYILDDDLPAPFKMGSASRWWLHHSLSKLNETLDHKLNIYLGDPKNIILNILQQNNIDAVYWNRCYEPWRIQQDTEIEQHLKEKGIQCHHFNASLLWEPWEILKNDGMPYKVFTPFYRNGCRNATLPRQCLLTPQNMKLIQDSNNKMVLNDLKLLPRVKWHAIMAKRWRIGEKNAQKTLNDFVENKVQDYKEKRNFPAEEKVSGLSPYLHFGEISPHQVWSAVQQQATSNITTDSSADVFLSELGWREFSYYLLYHFPKLPSLNFQKKFDKFPWKKNKMLLQAWQSGNTGYPIVDAGMRELWQTGYMHNRVRMIVGSFLVKNLLQPWHCGAAWFWDCLVDADLANNSASWQWIAGSGADAAPYFRIFNPITQGEKFDPLGVYTKRFIPELAQLPNKYLYQPWVAPTAVLSAAGVVLGKTYPNPIVDLQLSRQKALAAFSTLRNLIVIEDR